VTFVCVDANLILKLVLNEPDSHVARALWQSWEGEPISLIAPPLWLYEVTSVIRNRVHRNKLAPEHEQAIIATLHQLPIELLNPAGLHWRAWELARQFNRPAAYDSHYLALAELHDCPFWTADQRLYNTVRSELSWVQWLGNFTP